MTVQLADTEAFDRLATVADMVRSTTKRLQKLAALMAYLPTLSDESLAIAARFFSGIVFPRHDARTTQVGGSILWTALASVSGMPDESLAEAYTRHGDAGDVVGDVLAGQPASGHPLAWIEERFSALARASGSTARREIVRETLAVLGGNEARYFAKLLGGELRIGLKEAQVEEALARAFEQPIDQVRHANRLRGDIGEVAILARHGTLASARLALFHPIGFMLAQPLATPEAVVAVMPSPFVIEDKYDGIRAQAHVDGNEVRLFSRTLDDITHGYPDVVSSLRGLGISLVLDGELIAVEPEDRRRARPFAMLQRRLGRKAPIQAVLEVAPVSCVAYDLLATDHKLVLDASYETRRSHLVSLRWLGESAFMASNALGYAPEDLDSAFARARSAGNEGLIAKDPASSYTPGRRGKSWVKLKRARHAGRGRDRGRARTRTAPSRTIGLHIRRSGFRNRFHAAQRGQGVQRTD